MSFLIIQLFLSLLLLSSPKSPQDFRWEKRILISFDSKGFDADFISRHQKDIQDRKLLLVHSVDGKIRWTNSDEPLDSSSFSRLKTSIRSASSWALIGLDGGIKNQGEGQIRMDEIFRIIDAMPMRQSEIRRGGDSKP